MPELNLDTPTTRSPLDSIDSLVGETPLVELHYRIDGRPRRIFAKYELENMTGSVKDRIAAHILRRGYEDGTLQPGDVVVEASSGNTGISLAAIGKALGHDVRIYMPNWMSQERVQLMHTFGAEVIPVSHEQNGFIGAVRLAEDFASRHPHSFVARQFENLANIEAHEKTTGPEIERQLVTLGLQADAFVAGVGTGGTVMGVAQCLRREGRRVAIHPLEPANSPTLRTGHRVGHHRIQGISDEFVPSILRLDQLDDIVDVWDGDAILMAQALCRGLGLAVGISSGANVLGAMQLVERMADDAIVVTVLPDSNKKYLSTDLCHAEPVQEGYVSPRVMLDRFAAVR